MNFPIWSYRNDSLILLYLSGILFSEGETKVPIHISDSILEPCQEIIVQIIVGYFSVSVPTGSWLRTHDPICVFNLLSTKVDFSPGAWSEGVNGSDKDSLNVRYIIRIH